MKTEKQKRAEYTNLIHEGENIVIAPPGVINGEGGGETDVYTKAEVDSMIGSIDDQLDDVYTKEEVDEAIGEIDLSDKMDKENPNGTGTFSLNDCIASGTGSFAVGLTTQATSLQSFAEGRYTQSTSVGTHAEGQGTRASGGTCHAEGSNTSATNSADHSEGSYTTASGGASHAEGNYSQATGGRSHAEGYDTRATGTESHSEGNRTEAKGNNSHTEGLYTLAHNRSQHVFGEYNVEDTQVAGTGFRGVYIEIVGNGDENARSNARTLDWSGNEWLAGYILPVDGVVLPSSTAGSTKYFKLSVDDNGTISATEVTL